MIRTRWLVLLLLLTVACISRVHGQGGPPLITDDTETPGPGKWEIDVAATTELRHLGERQFQVPFLDINYGVGKNIELNYDLPLLVSANRNQSTQAGLGDSLIGVKWRFVDEEVAGVAISMFPQYTFNTPAGSVRHSLVANDQNVYLPFEFQKVIGVVELNLEAGPDIHISGPSEADYGLAAGHTFGNLEILGEIHGSTVGDFQEDDLVVEAGFRYQIKEGYTVLFSIGRSVYSAGTPAATFLSYTGMQFNF